MENFSLLLHRQSGRLTSQKISLVRKSAKHCNIYSKAEVFKNEETHFNEEVSLWFLIFLIIDQLNYLWWVQCEIYESTYVILKAGYLEMSKLIKY